MSQNFHFRPYSLALVTIFYVDSFSLQCSLISLVDGGPTETLKVFDESRD